MKRPILKYWERGKEEVSFPYGVGAFENLEISRCFNDWTNPKKCRRESGLNYYMGKRQNDYKTKANIFNENSKCKC